MFNIEQKNHGQITVWSLRGQLDALTIGDMKPAIEELFSSQVVQVVFDLEELSLIDSSGIGTVVSVFKRARAQGGDAKVANLANQPGEVFRILKLDKAIDVFDSVELALESF